MQYYIIAMGFFNSTSKKNVHNPSENKNSQTQTHFMNT